MNRLGKSILATMGFFTALQLLVFFLFVRFNVFAAVFYAGLLGQ